MPVKVQSQSFVTSIDNANYFDMHCIDTLQCVSFITWMLLLSTISNVASQSIGHYWLLISECNFREFMGYSVYFCQRWEWVNLEFRDFYYTVSAIKYNDDANGWYLLSKFLPSSYISTFCVVIVSLDSENKFLNHIWMWVQNTQY